MIKKVITFAILFLYFISVSAQEITRHQADSMIYNLKRTKSQLNRIYLLLDLAQFQTFKLGEDKIDFDSATTYINEAFKLNKITKSSEATGYMLLTESYLLREKNEIELAKKKAVQAVAILKFVGNKNYLGRAYFQLSEFYDHREPEQLDIKIEHVLNAVNAFHESKNVERWAFSQKMLADLYTITGEDQKAMDAIESALAAYQSINYKKMQSVYALLGSMYRLIKEDYGRALKYELMALKTSEEFQDTTMQLCEINNVIGGIYRELENNELALKHFKAALLTAMKYNDLYSVSLLVLNIAATYNYAGQPDKAIDFLKSIPQQYMNPTDELEICYIALAYCRSYVAAGQFEKAQPYCNTLLKLSNSSALFDDARFNINLVLANYFLGIGQYANTRKHLTLNKGIPPPFSRRYAHDCKLWYRLDSAQGNYRSAFNYLSLYKTVTDSLMTITKARQLQIIEVEYDTQKKEDLLKLKDKNISLLTQKNNLQQSNLAQASLIKNVTVGGIILLVIFLILLYRQYSHKKKINKIVFSKNAMLEHLVTEKEWLLKEIHHRVKNNFQTVMGLLGTQSGYLKNEVAISAIENSQHRIHVMSLIHQRLYQTENLSSINFSDYVFELTDYLRDSFIVSKPVRFDLQIEEVELDLAHCIPLGLILNEAITNSFKYAFSEKADGLITITFTSVNPNEYLLTIKDNGNGLPSGFNIAHTDTMGMNLMKGLSQEIDGDFTISSNKGTVISVGFVYISDVMTGITPLKKIEPHFA